LVDFIRAYEDSNNKKVTPITGDPKLASGLAFLGFVIFFLQLLYIIILIIKIKMMPTP
jgi:hypothetical protein